MRYISSQTERAVRFIGLSTALANAGYVYFISPYFCKYKFILIFLPYSSPLHLYLSMFFVSALSNPSHLRERVQDKSLFNQCTPDSCPSICSDLADWLGVEEIGLFNFKPSVRPVPLEVHIQASGCVVSHRLWRHLSVFS